MRIAVMGSGGVGSYWGGLLAQAGEQVTFIARGAHLEALRAQGLTIQSRVTGDFTCAVSATDDPNAIGPVDLVLFCVKTYDLDAAAARLSPLVGPHTMVLPLQNGIDRAERLTRDIGGESCVGRQVPGRQASREVEGRRQDIPGAFWHARQRWEILSSAPVPEASPRLT